MTRLSPRVIHQELTTRVVVHYRSNVADVYFVIETEALDAMGADCWAEDARVDPKKIDINNKVEWLLFKYFCSILEAETRNGNDGP